MDDSFKSFLQYVLEVTGKMERMAADENKVCAPCGTSYHAFRSSGKLGCAACYHVFRKNISAALTNIHGNNEFLGKIPKGQAHKYTDLLVKRELEENQHLLRRALEAEEYGLAAAYRDTINELMEKMAAHEKQEGVQP